MSAPKFRLVECAALDESGAIAHEIETDGHTVAHVYPNSEGYEDLLASAPETARERDALRADLESMRRRWDDSVKASIAMDSQIMALRAENAKLREALTKFVDCADMQKGGGDSMLKIHFDGPALTFARAALKGTP